MNHISESFETIFWVKIHKFFDAGPGSGFKKNRIRDPDWKKFGYRINIPDPQHCKIYLNCEEVLSCGAVINRVGDPHMLCSDPDPAFPKV